MTLLFKRQSRPSSGNPANVSHLEGNNLAEVYVPRIRREPIIKDEESEKVEGDSQLLSRSLTSEPFNRIPVYGSRSKREILKKRASLVLRLNLLISLSCLSTWGKSVEVERKDHAILIEVLSALDNSLFTWLDHEEVFLERCSLLLRCLPESFPSLSKKKIKLTKSSTIKPRKMQTPEFEGQLFMIYPKLSTTLGLFKFTKHRTKSKEIL